MRSSRKREKKVSGFEFLSIFPPSPPPRCPIVLAHHHFLPFGLEFFVQRNSASSPSHGLTVHRAHTRRNRNSRARQKHAPLLQPSRSTWAR
jgi:hypothetical protein